jgi:hypothetical protein
MDKLARRPDVSHRQSSLTVFSRPGLARRNERGRRERRRQSRLVCYPAGLSEMV